MAGLRSLFVAATASLLVSAAPNGLALVPPKGWSSWNAFHRNVTADLYTGSADAMVRLGLLAAGYNRINLDGGWWAGVDTGVVVRNSSGYMQEDRAKFPLGIAHVVDYVHAKGFLWGHYTDAGKAACNGDRPMSEGYEAQDVALFVSYGSDMLKVDACAVAEADKQTVMQKWATLLNASGRPVLLSNCRNGCLSAPGTPPPMQWQPWCAELTNMWRSSGDINATWKSMLYNLDSLKGRGSYAGPNAWNDPDLLEVGIGEFAWRSDGSTLGMNRAHFAMWAITSSPLIIGMDLRPQAQPAMELVQLVMNARALRVNEQYAGNAGDFVKAGQQAGTEIWAKPLPNNAAAVALLNRNQQGAPTPMSVSLSDVPGLPPGCTTANVTDVWTGDVSTTNGGTYTAPPVQPMSAAFITVDSCTA